MNVVANREEEQLDTTLPYPHTRIQSMVTLLKQLKKKLVGFLASDHHYEDSQLLAHLLDHTQSIVWKADLEFTLLDIKGSLSNLESKSMTDELKSLLLKEEYQLSQIRIEKSILLEHQLQGISVRTNIKPLFDTNQEIIGIIGVTTHCVQEPNQILAQQSEIQVLNNFLEAASHDLRTPLSVINTSLYLLEKTMDESKRSDRIEILKGSIDRLRQILDSMFLMARIDALPHYVSHPIQVDGLLQNVIINYHDLASAKNVKLGFRQFDLLPSIHGHESELQMAVSNVVENAIQNTEPSGFVEIQASKNDNQVIIQVIDSGNGISVQDLPHIFERFYRVDKYRPSGDTRVGLGLSIAKRVVEKHNGQITIKSEIGKGTELVIMLPI